MGFLAAYTLRNPSGGPATTMGGALQRVAGLAWTDMAPSAVAPLYGLPRASRPPICLPRAHGIRQPRLSPRLDGASAPVAG